MRLALLLRRRSAPQIASLLHAASRHAKGFERIIGDAIEHLGFDVQRLGEPGQPEGVATAIVTRGENDSHVAYSFTYDAKSSIRGKSKTHNVGIAGLVRHRRDHNADHVLVVAPDFEQGALEKECAEHSVAPMRADDLARLVMITAGCGPLSLVEFRDVVTSVKVVENPGEPSRVMGQAACDVRLRSGSVWAASIRENASICM